ncbi:MAG: hypothetical protein R6U30_10660, partial [Halomonas sp.]|uniref:hypothetical protein n=1 Tax=Halomonas sp. TaxID=1486246 RepID=UPI003970DCC1
MKGLKNIEYGERCKTDEDGNTVRIGSGCEKEDDPRPLVFHFNPEVFSVGESFNLELKKIENLDRFRINEDSINIPMKVYPEFKIIHTVPANGSQSVLAGGGLYMCTNVPLKEPEGGYVDEYSHAEGYVVYGKMDKSKYISRKHSYVKCNEGEFETWFQ